MELISALMGLLDIIAGVLITVSYWPNVLAIILAGLIFGKGVMSFI
jgi:uncharacterized membrane protein